MSLGNVSRSTSSTSWPAAGKQHRSSCAGAPRPYHHDVVQPHWLDQTARHDASRRRSANHSSNVGRRKCSSAHHSSNASAPMSSTSCETCDACALSARLFSSGFCVASERHTGRGPRRWNSRAARHPSRSETCVQRGIALGATVGHRRVDSDPRDPRGHGRRGHPAAHRNVIGMAGVIPSGPKVTMMSGSTP